MKKDNYRGFELKTVTWGYRDIFKKTIDRLYEKKFLGDSNWKTTEVFFEFLRRGASYCFGHVLKEFLTSLHSENLWIMRLPELFSDWVGLGIEYADFKTSAGIKYFEIWSDGGFGNCPGDVKYVITKSRQLKETDIELSFCFIQSYAELKKHLSHDEIDLFLEYVLKIFMTSPESSYTFLLLKTKTSRIYLREATREVRLSHIKQRLKNLMRSIAGIEFDIDNLGKLDSDELLERGSQIVQIAGNVYFPARASACSSKEGNLNYYLSTASVCAACSLFRSFAVAREYGGAATSLEYIKRKKAEDPALVNNLFLHAELFRILRKVRDVFSGAVPGLKDVLRLEMENMRICSGADALSATILEFFIQGKDDNIDDFGQNTNPGMLSALRVVRKAADGGTSFDKVVIAAEMLLSEFERNNPCLDYFSETPAPLSFFPDYMYPGQINPAPEESLDHDLDDSEKRKNKDSKKEKEAKPLSGAGEKHKKNDGQDISSARSGYFYDEWNEPDREYYENWCCLNEKTPDISDAVIKLPPELERYSKNVKRVFEKLKPELTRKEKYLKDGDTINVDRLVDFLCLKKAKINSEQDFYEKPFINKRDLAVGLLVDLSGSTGENISGQRRVIDLEKDSACILGEALSETGDRFGIFGFTGSGRENSEFYIFKDFAEGWDKKARMRLYSGVHGNSTRMGVALRHMGRKLESVEAKQKLIILITDGKPMDSGYDPATRYAQYDVRRANEENLRSGINAFCISTDENKIEDLEIMFPARHYVIIKSMETLPETLSKLYLKITA